MENDRKKEILYKCQECGLFYAKKELMEQCEEWCKKNKSCNLNITKHAIQVRKYRTNL